MFQGKPNSNFLHGSAVVDLFNTSGFSTGDPLKPPYLLVYTKDEGDSKNPKYSQNLAVSRDGGKTWEDYDRNPIIRNDGGRSLMAPKVLWHPQMNKWVMTITNTN